MNLDNWVARKLARRAITIKAAKTVEVTYSRPLGPRGEFAKITLYAEPASEFSFSSEAQWPENPEEFDGAVLEGILDETLATDLGPIIRNVAFTLKVIGWHEVDSNSRAFYHAARKAVVEITEKGNFKNNIDYMHGKT